MIVNFPRKVLTLQPIPITKHLYYEKTLSTITPQAFYTAVLRSFYTMKHFENNVKQLKKAFEKINFNFAAEIKSNIGMLY